MASLEIRDIYKQFGSVEVLKNINLAIEDGEFMVLVGPSGCGKSTLLNIIAGLESSSGGEILIQDQVVTDVHPKDRDIAMVFQSYALYPNMTVRKNITFGMEVRKVASDVIDEAVERVADLLQIRELLSRKPAQLSGGQRQRVAMGRALVRDPSIFLFDEPLSNLDAQLRVEMRTEIKKLHQRLGSTIVYVTHDQIEAMTLATRIAVLKDGVLQQFDTPQNIYDHPANVFVAGFMGSPAMNLIPARLLERNGKITAEVLLEDKKPVLLELLNPPESLRTYLDKDVLLGLRPEAFGDKAAATGSNTQLAEAAIRVELTEPTGPDVLTVISMGGIEVTARMDPKSNVAPGQITDFTIDMEKAVLFDPGTGGRL